MKKKILALCLVIALAVTAVTGVTLAYFTDTDEATNTFTSGKVDITLVEDFGDNDPNTDEKLMPGQQNAVKKEVKIKLEKGSEESYVWYEWLIPAALDSVDGSTGLNNIVHVNSYGYTWDKYAANENYWPEGQNTALPADQLWSYDKVGNPEGFIGTEKIDGVTYNVYVALYNGTLTAEKETTPAMSQVYLDKDVDTNADGNYVKGDKVIDAKLLQDFNIIVRAYAIQAAGIDNVVDAYNAYKAQ